jgi:hypothetical protein
MRIKPRRMLKKELLVSLKMMSKKERIKSQKNLE